MSDAKSSNNILKKVKQENKKAMFHDDNSI